VLGDRAGEPLPVGTLVVGEHDLDLVRKLHSTNDGWRV
jgi:hypothetical protein